MTDLTLKDATSISNEMTMSQRKLLSTRESTKENKNEKSNRSSHIDPTSPLKSPKKNRDLSQLASIYVERKKNKNSQLKEDPLNLNSDESDPSVRRDIFGNVIKKGPGKKQRISFVDKISNTNFLDVVYVESYKAYNLDVSNNKTKCGCGGCIIF
jgi:hypothetical protein